ncbi:MAG: FtsQ-type POTRA domain-containing protein [Selenomonadaceae bacterium]|nr:FtsQ-type POTRA domain-containing protein [Selenomonadaceae bacterium]
MAKIKRVHRSGRRIFKGIIFLIITCAILGAFVYVPFFTLTNINLNGANYITTEDVIKIGNIYIGEPLFELETDTIATRLSSDLRIEEVTVRRKLPGTLEVTIKERKPVATIICDYGYLDLDKSGTILDSYKTLKVMQIPMITGATVHDKYIGDTVEDKMVKEVLIFLQKINADALNKISEIAIIEENYIVAYTNTERSVQIRIGKLERLDEKARLTEDFLKNLENNPNPIEYVDFNYTAPFIKLAK